MEDSEYDDSPSLDDPRYSLFRNSSQHQTILENVDQLETDDHEHFHILHYEAQERATAASAELGSGSAGLPRTTPLAFGPDVRRAITEMKKKIGLLENQLAMSSVDDEVTGAVPDALRAVPLPTSQVEFGVGVDESLSLPHVVPQLCQRSWSDFMNKHVESEFEYAVEILMGDPALPSSAKDPVNPAPAPGKGRKLNVTLKGALHSAISADGSGSAGVPERIRINSAEILQALADIDRNIDPTTPIVMLRPFKFLIHYEDKIRAAMQKAELEIKGSSGESHGLDSSSEQVGTESSSSAQNSSSSSTVDNQGSTFQHLQCLVDFVDRFIKPTTDRLQDVSEAKVTFQNLWYIFNPGDDIFMPLRLPQGRTSFDAAKTIPEVFQGRYNMMWRVISTAGGRPNLAASQSRTASLKKPNIFKVRCYYIDFDGRYFLPTIHTFSILPFKGEREITSLEFFPTRYLKTAKEQIADHFDKGKMIFDDIAASFSHYYYTGPTLTSQPCGCPLQSEHRHQEHVESEVIVDFRTALIRNPSWRPKATLWKMLAAERREVEGTCRVRFWKDAERSKPHSFERDHVYDDYHIDRERAVAFKQRETIFNPIPSSWLCNESMVPKKDVILLPGRVFAFVLRTRSFAPLWLWHLQPINPQQEGLRHLQLRDESVKDTIQALVRTHFIQRTTQHEAHQEHDSVKGKGKGLIILLHGAPGVGKTFTAESVAAANGKPLFQISCGDLGLTPQEVERSLKEIFRYAQLWNCVLLLDECDIFLTQRTIHDVKRNSLVSVFLRVLEFYTGVLFLTTNRVGTLDTAIKSRLTWIAYYPPLDIQQTRKIWKVNLKLLKERNRRLQIETDGILQFARDHYISSSRKYATWNGRQIQNAFKVATALAEWDAYSQGVQSQIDTRVSERDVPARPKLLAAHFQTIANATQVFDSYLQETTGSSEADRAFNAMERADNYNLEEDAYNSAISHTQGRSGSSGHLGPPQPLNPDPAPSAHYPPSQRRRPSNPQGPSRSSFSYSGTSTNNHPAPPPLNQRSVSVQHGAVPQLQSPWSPRAGPPAAGQGHDSNGTHSGPSPTTLLKPNNKKGGRQRSTSNNARRRQQQGQDSYFGDYGYDQGGGDPDHDGTGDWRGSSSAGESEHEGDDDADSGNEGNGRNLL